MKENTLKVAAVIVGIALLVGLSIGRWKLGWWMERETTNRRTSIANNSMARQSALQASVLDKYATVTDIDVQISTATPQQAEALSAQRKAIVTQFCSDYSIITITVPANVVDFAYQECN